MATQQKVDPEAFTLSDCASGLLEKVSGGAVLSQDANKMSQFSANHPYHALHRRAVVSQQWRSCEDSNHRRRHESENERDRRNPFLQLLQQQQQDDHQHFMQQLLKQQRHHEQQHLDRLQQPQHHPLRLLQLPQQYWLYLPQQQQQLMQQQVKMSRDSSLVGIGLQSLVFVVMVFFGFA
mmetsp:Transcript_9068/g.19555  ORF Transcript_9068/g.19555 Transcript_9068/m.19555 type:complete len:179 (+) Transcript_9068:89-625(+)